MGYFCTKHPDLNITAREKKKMMQGQVSLHMEKYSPLPRGASSCSQDPDCIQRLQKPEATTLNFPHQQSVRDKYLCNCPSLHRRAKAKETKDTLPAFHEIVPLCQ